jgi:uroporphyrinogen decarboxylase
MTGWERVRAALNHVETDRVPRLLYGEVIGYVPEIKKLLYKKCAPLTPCKYFNMDLTGLDVNPTKLKSERFAPWYGEKAHEALSSGELDEWGVWWKKGSYFHFARIHSPLKNSEGLGAIREFPLPDLDQGYRFEGLKGKVARLHSEGFAVAAVAGSIFEQSWYLRGMDTLMVDMIKSPDIANYLFDAASYYQKKSAREFAKTGVDIIMAGDDVATQRGLMISTDTWRTYFKPRLASMVSAVKDIDPRIQVFYHSCGNIEELIPELIETGIDILNPLQPDCMDPLKIKMKYGDRLSFWGSVSVQSTMSLGTAEDVRAEVAERVKTLGIGGGFILSPAHVLAAETPWENIKAFFEASEAVSTENIKGK